MARIMAAVFIRLMLLDELFTACVLADAIGRIIYCVCPGCAFGSNHPLAVQARLDNKKIKRGKK